MSGLDERCRATHNKEPEGAQVPRLPGCPLAEPLKRGVPRWPGVLPGAGGAHEPLYVCPAFERWGKNGFKIMGGSTRMMDEYGRSLAEYLWRTLVKRLSEIIHRDQRYEGLRYTGASRMADGNGFCAADEARLEQDLNAATPVVGSYWSDC